MEFITVNRSVRSWAWFPYAYFFGLEAQLQTDQFVVGLGFPMPIFLG